MFFKASEQELLKRIQSINTDDMFFWRLPNLVYPLILVGASLIGYAIFKPISERSWEGFINLLFNGSLAMIAVNRISSVGSNLFKHDKTFEGRAKIDTVILRVKIDDYSKILLLFIVFLYVYQVIHNPVKASWWLWLELFITIVFIYWSMILSRYAYLLQERLIERTLGDDIKDEAKVGKQHLRDKYDND